MGGGEGGGGIRLGRGGRHCWGARGVSLFSICYWMNHSCWRPRHGAESGLVMIGGSSGCYPAEGSCYYTVFFRSLVFHASVGGLGGL